MKNQNHMRINHRVRMLLWLLPVLVSSLACSYVTQLILPSTPVPTATLIPTQTATLTPTPLPPTPEFQAACPSLLSDVLSTATASQNDSILFSAHRRPHEDRSRLRYLVTYSLKDDRLHVRTDVSVPRDFEEELDERTTHEQIWNYFAALIPAEDRDFLVEFGAMSDGRSNILGGVRRTDENPDQWLLRVDILDADDRYELTYTLLHEFGHLLTLNSSQVKVDRSVYLHPDDLEIYDRAQAACTTYFSDDGCSLQDSYLHEFFNRYWSSFFLEWQEIDKAKEDDSYYAQLYDFYELHADQFLTEYAATSPEEDIAESLAFFILAEKPELDSIADEKILFFYEYPQLVELRQEILTRVCVEFPG